MSAMQLSDYEIVKHSIPSMGGLLEVAITVEPERRAAAAEAARRAAQRVEVWASRLTRFSNDSDLSALNASGESEVSIRPTLAAALRWAEDAHRRSHGVVDATMLDQRLAAESGADVESDSVRAWRVAEAAAGRASVVERRSDFRFDLDGVAKGWIADRAADLLHGWPGVAVDADGDISFQADSGVEWLVAVADPRLDDDAEPLATLRLHGGDGWSRSYGVATSGTSVHRWQLSDGRTTHHLIDRRTGLPADTDVIQATVIAPTAREAEMIAKSAVILGAREAYEFLTHSSAHAAILLLDCDDVVALPGIEKWLA